MLTNDRDRGGRGGHETETDDATTKTHRMKTKKTKTVPHPCSKPIRNITNTEDILYTHNIYSVMATRRHKIARSAVRRVKRRNSKNAKLRTLRSRKNTTEKKARLNMREMRGGAVDFRMFEVHFGKMNGDDDLTQPEFRNANTLIGTLCYYPKDGDFYFCVYDSATSHVMMISIFYAICRLCGIEPTSETTANLIILFKKQLYDKTHPFYFNEIEEELPQTNNEYLKLKHRTSYSSLFCIKNAVW